MQRPIISLTLIIGAIGIISTGCVDASSQKNVPNAQDDQALLGQKNGLEREGKDLEEIGDFDGAIEKYRQAADLGIKIYGSDRGRSMAFMAHAYEKKGEYETALPYVKMLTEHHPDQLNYYDWQDELEALIEFKKSSDPQHVRDYIQSYIQKYQSGLPPIASDIDAVLKITRILALYDMIGDAQSGIDYINMVLEYAYKEAPGYDAMATSEVAMATSKKRDTAENRKRRRGYEVIAGYLRVREAFERDKASGSKGSATKVLIQSDYFPW